MFWNSRRRNFPEIAFGRNSEILLIKRPQAILNFRRENTLPTVQLQGLMKTTDAST